MDIGLMQDVLSKRCGRRVTIRVSPSFWPYDARMDVSSSSGSKSSLTYLDKRDFRLSIDDFCKRYVVPAVTFADELERIAKRDEEWEEVSTHMASGI